MLLVNYIDFIITSKQLWLLLKSVLISEKLICKGQNSKIIIIFFFLLSNVLLSVNKSIILILYYNKNFYFELMI